MNGCTHWSPDPKQPLPGDLDAYACRNCSGDFSSHENPFGKPESCQTCPLYREPGIVRGFGPKDAKMMFVAEAPGEEEVDPPMYRPEQMRPFRGGAGRILTALCSHAGIDRREVFITNCVKCRPPGNRLPTELELVNCAHFLIEEIESVNSNVIVAFGETALGVLTGKKGISLWRGVPTEGFAGRKVFPQWHPAFIARAQYNWPFAVHDLVRAQAQSAYPEIRRIPFEIVRDASVARDGDGILTAARARGAAIFDFETTGLVAGRDSIVYCGIAAGTDQAYILNWSGDTKRFFQQVLDEPGVQIVGQNILYFDLPFAEAKGVSLEKAYPKVFDTMVAFHLVNSSYGQTPIAEQTAQTYRARGAEKDLSMIASCHTDIEYWKSRESYKADLKRVCGIDVIATGRAALDPDSGLQRELAAYDMTDLYWKHVLPVHPILSRMSKQGVRIDEGRAVAWMEALEAKAETLEAELKEGLGEPFLNLNSPKQMMELLYGKLGLPIQYTQDKKKGMRPTANAEAIESLADMFPESASLMSIVDIRLLRKLVSTFILPGLQRGRFFPKFGVSKASTGRFNSWDPNAQNIPEDLRDLWTADDDDCVLLVGDWSQIEWRIAMVLSGDPVGLELLASGVDNHRAVAAEVLGKDPRPCGLSCPAKCPTHITENERYSAKFIVYGLGYGRGAESIATGFGSQRGRVRRSGISRLPLDWVEGFIARFWAKFSTFKTWRDSNVDFVKRNHYLANAFKRRRWWYTWAVTEVYNYPMQSNAADMMYDALILLDRQLPKGADLRLTVHDEVVLNVPKHLAREAWICLRDVMQQRWEQIVESSARPENVRKYYPNGWFCPVDIHVGTNWKATKSKDPADREPRLALEKHLGLSDLTH